MLDGAWSAARRISRHRSLGNTRSASVHAVSTKDWARAPPPPLLLRPNCSSSLSGPTCQAIVVQLGHLGG
eukprot:13701874-Alexandrium_andersonii.AAC.1